MESDTGHTIKVVAELTGVPLHTLRAWERRYGIPRPNRHAENRYRLYDEQDIADVRWMKRQVDGGVSPAQASAQLRRQQREQTLPGALPSPPLANLQTALVEAFVRRDEAAARQVLNEAWSAFAPEQVLVQVIQPALSQIGDRWQQNLLSVEQEHFASNLVRQRLHALIQGQSPAGFNAPRLIAACAPEEQHDLGLLMVTLLARRAGWQVDYLGQRTPLAELHRAAGQARYIVISASTVTGLASLVPVWSAPLPASPLLFGGHIFNVVPTLRAHMPGGFLGETCVEAVQRLEAIMPYVPDWKPPRRLWNTALAFDRSRLHIVDGTVRQFMSHASVQKSRGRDALTAELTLAALFLTDALVSALAFDAPELMDAQGAWATEFLPAHQVPLETLHPFLNLYTAVCEENLPSGLSKPVRELVMRLARSADSGRENDQVVSTEMF